MKVRLHVTESCKRACKGCCMKQPEFSLDSVPAISSAKELPSDTEMVLITGGEPMMMPFKVMTIARDIDHYCTNARIIVYTAGPYARDRSLTIEEHRLYRHVAAVVHGFTYTLHEPEDIPAFLALLEAGTFDPSWHSLRLNVFESVSIEDFPASVKADLLLWDIRWGYVWMEDCPLPEGEVFMKWA